MFEEHEDQNLNHIPYSQYHYGLWFETLGYFKCESLINCSVLRLNYISKIWRLSLIKTNA